MTAVWQLAEGERYRELVGTFVALDIGFGAPGDRRILEARAGLGNARAGRFRLEQPRPMAPGRYRLDVAADGQPWASADVTIAAESEGPPVPPLEQVVPLVAGQVWRYAFTQEAGEGAHVSLPDIAPAADGKLHASVTYAVVGTDEAGTRIDMRRNGKLVLQEWWRVEPEGLAITQRRAGSELSKLDPPELILAWPPGIRQWDWPAPNAAGHEHYELWGPLPLNAPGGAVPGYVVLARAAQPDGLAATIERRFAPGIGLVREHTVIQLGPITALRQDVVLDAIGVRGAGESR